MRVILFNSFFPIMGMLGQPLTLDCSKAHIYQNNGAGENEENLDLPKIIQAVENHGKYGLKDLWKNWVTITVSSLSTPTAEISNIMQVDVSGNLLQTFYELMNKRLKIFINTKLLKHKTLKGKTIPGVVDLGSAALTLTESMLPEGVFSVTYRAPSSHQVLQLLRAGPHNMKISVCIIIAVECDNDLFNNLSPVGCTLPLRNSLRQSLFTDFALVAGNGVRVKCHKVVLAGFSTKFAQVLTSGTQEAITSEMEIKRRNGTSISEEGVRAFLEFLYDLGSDKAKNNPHIADELLELSRMYGLSNMETKMNAILAAMGHTTH